MENTLPDLAERYQLAENQEWSDLLRHLEFYEGFALILLLAPDAFGVRVCRDALHQHVAGDGKSLHLIRISAKDPPEKLALALARDMPQNTAVVWVQLERRDPLEGQNASSEEANGGPEREL